MNYLNLGCGPTFIDDWTNIDFVSNSKHVIAHNLLKGIPFEDNTFDCVYHSHVLEHFSKLEAKNFIAECYRVLKPEGIIRIAIPDLEQIAINYLKYLNESLENIEGADKKYEWTMLELFDQVVREKSGGGMLEYIKDESKKNDDFLLFRNGNEVEKIMLGLRNQNPVSTPKNNKLRKILSSIYHLNIKHYLEKFILKENYNTYKIGQFRKQGEIHQWMYDRYSLKKILEEQGFVNVKKMSAFTSEIKEWDSYKLDGENGKIRKPDSLFMEAYKK